MHTTIVVSTSGVLVWKMAQGKSKAPQDILSELGVEDLYNFLGVEFQATDKEVENSLYCNLKKSYI